MFCCSSSLYITLLFTAGGGGCYHVCHVCLRLVFHHLPCTLSLALLEAFGVKERAIGALPRERLGTDLHVIRQRLLIMVVVVGPPENPCKLLERVEDHDDRRAHGDFLPLLHFFGCVFVCLRVCGCVCDVISSLIICMHTRRGTYHHDHHGNQIDAPPCPEQGARGGKRGAKQKTV